MSDEELKQALEHIHVMQEDLNRIRNKPNRYGFTMTPYITELCEIQSKVDKLENLISYAMIQKGIEP